MHFNGWHLGRRISVRRRFLAWFLRRRWRPALRRLLRRRRVFAGFVDRRLVRWNLLLIRRI
jgi:hypothetical protein